ncbi:hypothetical protein ACFLS9_04465 [Bacteroidota bacterium]
MDMEEHIHPTGESIFPEPLNEKIRGELINSLRNLPQTLRKTVNGSSEDQLNSI